VNDAANTALFEKYRGLARERGGVIFGGRLGSYRYMDMDEAVGAALSLARGLPARA
jgi:UDP-galactopyranose mutase